MKLDKIRQEIDAIDAQMKELFLQRMQLSAQVAEAKKQTDAAVYVPEREQDVLHFRTEGVEEEYLPECRDFFRRMMEIGRGYQYSKLSERVQGKSEFLIKNGTLELQFFLQEKNPPLAVFLNALLLAELKIERIFAKEGDGKMECKLVLSGDFSCPRAKAAVLQILEEAQEVRIGNVSEGWKESEGADE